MEPFSILCYILAGLLFAFGIWCLFKAKLAIGEPYDKIRKELEEVRQILKEVETKITTESNTKEFAEQVEHFNQLAKRLRVPLYSKEGA